MGKEIKNVVIYTRVSTEEQVDNYSLANQESDLKDYCRRNNWNIIEHYSDKGITGTSIDKRTGLKEMLFTANRKESNIDAIVIWKLSRISRKTRDLLNIVGDLSDNGIALISYKDNINSLNQDSKLIMHFSGLLSEIERDNLVVQIRGGMSQRAREGRWNGGKAPIGYDYMKEADNGKGMLVINNEEANTVRKIFQLFTEEKFGFSKITKYLNERSTLYTTKNKNIWYIATVKFVLDNPIYVGKIRWGYHKEWNKLKRKGKTKDYILEEGLHEPIISKETWEKTREIRSKANTPEKKVHLVYLLTRLVKCPVCGASMVSHRVKKKKINEYYRYYACSKWTNSKTCKPNLVNGDKIEREVIDIVNEFITQKDIHLILKDNISLTNTDMDLLKKELEAIDNSLKKLVKEENKYYEYLADESKLKQLSESKLLEMISIKRKNIDSLEGDKEEILEEIYAQKNIEMNIEEISLILKNFKLLFDKSDTSEQKELLQTLIKEVRVIKTDKISKGQVTEVILNIKGLSLYFKEKRFEVEYDRGNRITSKILSLGGETKSPKPIKDWVAYLSEEWSDE